MKLWLNIFLGIFCLHSSIAIARINNDDNDEYASWKAKKREFYKHEFFEKKLSELSDPEPSTSHLFIRRAQSVIKVLLSLFLSFTLSLIIVSIIYQLPCVRQELAFIERSLDIAKKGKGYLEQCSTKLSTLKNTIKQLQNQPKDIPQKPADFDFDSLVNRCKSRQKEMETLFGTIVASIFSVLSPLSFAFVDFIWQRTKKTKAYLVILEEYVAQWTEFKICTPKIFWDRMETLFLGYLANNKKLPLQEEEAEALVKIMIMESINKKWDYDYF